MRTPRPHAIFARTAALLAWASAPLTAQDRVLDARSHHLRSGEGVEWAEFAPGTPASSLALDFRAGPNPTGWTLSLRQADVKRQWRLLVNGREIGALHQDENAIVGYWPVPAGVLVEGTNTLRIEPADSVLDDVRVERIELLDRPLAAVLSEASLELEVVDGATGDPLPARFTVADEQGRLHTVAGGSGGDLAVRPGFVYTRTGRASLGLPAGSYRVFAGRGFEYGVDSLRVALRPGDRLRRRLTIRREVPTPGWIAADPHVHTLTYSGHGDATLAERVITVAGEGVELAVLTDHNLHADLDSVATRMGVRGHFTPVIGNEVTTPVGHFNIFPVSTATPAPAAGVRSWAALSPGIASTGAGAVILNHARDVHLGFRPFGTERHVPVAGVDLDRWVLGANAMEVVNSGSQQTDPLRLFHDWLGMLNRGRFLTPVGASDSHDVGRYVVGQARTYIRARDDEPGRVDVSAAVERFRAGAVMVSFGLLAEITVGDRYGPGELVPAAEPLVVSVRVLGPAWTRAERVSLFANGRRLHSERIERGDAPGLKWSATWRLPRPAHDVFLVALAEGPGEPLPFWPIAKPYQPASPEWSPRVIGVSGALWVDADGDGRPTDAHTYAARLLAASGDDLDALARALAPYDEAVAAQAAGILLERGIPPTHVALGAALRGAAPATRRGFAAFTAEWLESQAARSSAPATP